jgi:hypothetical protein
VPTLCKGDRQLPADSIHENAGSRKTKRNCRLAILTIRRVRARHVSLILYHAALLLKTELTMLLLLSLMGDILQALGSGRKSKN